MLQSLLPDANWVKLNEAELAILCLEAPGLEHAMLAFCAQFDLEMLVVTCGAKGAVACDRQQHFVTVQPPASNTVVDTVGVADAFAALLLLGLNKQWPLDATLERAQEFACVFVGRCGTTVAHRDFYSAFNASWH